MEERFIIKLLALLIFFLPVSLLANEPKWIAVEPVKIVTGLGVTLNDVESRLKDGHPYTHISKITWVHETTHGINSLIRNKYKVGHNAFYVLDGKGIVFKEPKTTLTKIAGNIPPELRGPSYELYLVQQRKDWNDCPLYLFDEWTAYINGSICGVELNHEGWEYSLLQAHNFNVYCIYTIKTVRDEHKEYDVSSLDEFLKWNLNRTLNLLDKTKSKRVQAYFDLAKKDELVNKYFVELGK